MYQKLDSSRLSHRNIYDSSEQVVEVIIGLRFILHSISVSLLYITFSWSTACWPISNGSKLKKDCIYAIWLVFEYPKIFSFGSINQSFFLPNGPLTLKMIQCRWESGRRYDKSHRIYDFCFSSTYIPCY